MRISDVCTRDVAHIPASETVRTAAGLMRDRHVGSLIVVRDRSEGQPPLGILTDRDIVLGVTAPGIDPDTLTVGDVMTAAPATCTEDEDLFDAVRTMRARGVRRLPVVDAVGALAGVITADDIHAALGMEQRELGRALTHGQVRERAMRD